MAVQTVLPIGKTLKMYSVSSDINDEVVMSMDGAAPHGFDHTEYGSDGDPIPMFAAGYGVNWRLAQGLNTVGIDLALDSQRLKLKNSTKPVLNSTSKGMKTWLLMVIRQWVLKTTKHPTTDPDH